MYSFLFTRRRNGELLPWLVSSNETSTQKGMLLVIGYFNANVGRWEPSEMSSAVMVYGFGETNEASEQLEDVCL